MWGWLKRKPLTPGLCECTHNRSSHVKGRGHCTVCIDYSENVRCACQIYIPASVPKENLGVEELERIYNRK